MSEVIVLQGIRCKFGWHRWGTLKHDYWGDFHTCTHCDLTNRLPSQQPPQKHDK